MRAWQSAVPEGSADPAGPSRTRKRSVNDPRGGRAGRRRPEREDDEPGLARRCRACRGRGRGASVRGVGAGGASGTGVGAGVGGRARRWRDLDPRRVGRLVESARGRPGRAGRRRRRRRRRRRTSRCSRRPSVPARCPAATRATSARCSAPTGHSSWSRRRSTRRTRPAARRWRACSRLTRSSGRRARAAWSPPRSSASTPRPGTTWSTPLADVVDRDARRRAPAEPVARRREDDVVRGAAGAEAAVVPGRVDDPGRVRLDGGERPAPQRRVRQGGSGGTGSGTGRRR